MESVECNQLSPATLAAFTFLLFMEKSDDKLHSSKNMPKEILIKRHFQIFGFN